MFSGGQSNGDGTMSYPASTSTSAPSAAAAKPSKMPRTEGGADNNAAEAKGGGEEKRRQERNLREQQRSHKITEQIKELRAILSESNIPFKPTKFSILASVVECVKQLQTHSTFLDAEHQKLIDTINQTSQMMASGQTPAESSAAPTPNRIASVGNDADMLLVQDIDYRNVFIQCSAAFGVAALDGRFIDCNTEFEVISGYSKEQLAQLSLFNLLTNTDMEAVFKVMGKMLKEKNPDDEAAASLSQSYWSGEVFTPHNSVNTSVLMNITLARSPDGMPKFFNCSLTPS